MSQELLYTSAPRGLKPGSRGFCTVLSTQGMPAPLATAVEGLSGYRPVYPSNDERAARNPVVYSHLKMQATGRTWHVLSRIADFGLDYSQRTNKLAHHVILDNQSEQLPGGPANLLSMPGFMREEWEGEPKVVALKPVTREPGGPKGVCQHWQEVTGDAGWAGVVAESFLRDPERLVILLFEPGLEVLPLFAEALSLLPPEQRWDVTFSTYFTGLATGTICAWRAIVRDSKEAHESLRFVHALRIDLTVDSLDQAAGGELVDNARSGDRTATATTRAQLSKPASLLVDETETQFEEITETKEQEEIRIATVLHRPPQLTDGRSAPPIQRSDRGISDAHNRRTSGKTSRRRLWFPLAISAFMIATSVVLFTGVWFATHRRNREYKNQALETIGDSQTYNSDPDNVSGKQNSLSEPASPTTGSMKKQKDGRIHDQVANDGHKPSPDVTQAANAAEHSAEATQNAKNGSSVFPPSADPGSERGFMESVIPNSDIAVQRQSKDLPRPGKRSLLFQMHEKKCEVELRVFAPEWTPFQRSPKPYKASFTQEIPIFAMGRTGTDAFPVFAFTLTHNDRLVPIHSDLALECKNATEDIDQLQWAVVRADVLSHDENRTLLSRHEFSFANLPYIPPKDRHFKVGQQSLTWDIGLPVVDISKLRLVVADLAMKIGDDTFLFSSQTKADKSKYRFASLELRDRLQSLYEGRKLSTKEASVEPEMEIEFILSKDRRLQLRIGLTNGELSFKPAFSNLKMRWKAIDEEFKKLGSQVRLLPLTDEKKDVGPNNIVTNLDVIDRLIRDIKKPMENGQSLDGAKEGEGKKSSAEKVEQLEMWKVEMQSIYEKAKLLHKSRQNLVGGEVVDAKVEYQLTELGGKDKIAVSIIDLGAK